MSSIIFHYSYSDFFPVRYSCRTHTAAELLASRKMNRRSIFVAPSSRVHLSTHRCVHSKRRRDF